MPILDCSGFTDYLFCVYAFLSPGGVNQNDIVCMNKSQFQKEIFEHLLTTAISRLGSNQISMNTVAHIMRTTHLLASRSKDNRGWNLHEDEWRSIIYRFCSSLPKVDGWVVVVLATSQLTHWHWPPNPTRLLEGLAGVSWVYEALESAVPGEDTTKWDSEIAAGVSNLLLALYYYDAPPLKEHIHLIVKAISMGGHISRPAGLLLLRRDVVDWFQDPPAGTNSSACICMDISYPLDPTAT
ncbi:hypothetical protein B0H14DRAFT_841899 [Mycena olivaceomarginata]|nr:hypothetical protein B0H14DRAFT_841899 [Mycena olivaceomarginata]